MDDNLKTLHSNLVNEGYQLPSFDNFKIDMLNPINSAKLHSNLVKEGYELPDYDTFLGDMGLLKKKRIRKLLQSLQKLLPFRKKNPQ